jgi:hypothetical protein
LQCYGEEILKKYFISEYSHPFGLLKIDFDVFINDWKQYLRQIYS